MVAATLESRLGWRLARISQQCIRSMALVKVRTPRGWRLPCLVGHKKKKNLLPAREHEPVAHQSRDFEWWRGALQYSSVAMPAPLNRLAHTTLPLTPALAAFIGPKQRNTMIVLEMASTAGTCHWVSTAPDGIDTTDEAFSLAPGASPGKAALCLPHWIEQCRWDSMHLAWTPTRPNTLPAGRSRTAENLPLCKFEPMWTCTTCTADQTEAVKKNPCLTVGLWGSRFAESWWAAGKTIRS